MEGQPLVTKPPAGPSPLEVLLAFGCTSQPDVDEDACGAPVEYLVLFHGYYAYPDWAPRCVEHVGLARQMPGFIVDIPVHQHAGTDAEPARVERLHITMEKVLDYDQRPDLPRIDPIRATPGDTLHLHLKASVPLPLLADPDRRERELEWWANRMAENTRRQLAAVEFVAPAAADQPEECPE